ncbi:putative membrane protein [Labilithrix luteola]|uniref:Putative membrane protein n=1 Tax=Labilithrix luteola TaxID=1391654 RepID=A0A0K1QFN1_9BACT|nr:GlsB/YeaQ/YmgE family stress response membrane protein [Labilithrix luteola]AKV04533.1 putative membrane protein [Labilithrix luteola]
MGLLTFILLGLVAGLIARALMPGRQSMGLVATTLLGIAGSFVGGLLGSLFHGGRNGHLLDLRPSGIIGSILGALIVLFLFTRISRHRAAAT